MKFESIKNKLRKAGNALGGEFKSPEQIHLEKEEKDKLEKQKKVKDLERKLKQAIAQLANIEDVGTDASFYGGLDEEKKVLYRKDIVNFERQIKELNEN